MQKILFLFIIITALVIGSHPLLAIPADGPRIVTVPAPAGKECRRISTAGVDHGEDVAQEYADELLAGDIEVFKTRNGIKRVSIGNRFRKCKFHLWFFGNEYNCTSSAVICWQR
jgi:hypothetical protein